MLLTSIEDAERAVYATIYRRALASPTNLDQNTMRLTALLSKELIADDGETDFVDHNDDDKEISLSYIRPLWNRFLQEA